LEKVVQLVSQKSFHLSSGEYVGKQEKNELGQIFQKYLSAYHLTSKARDLKSTAPDISFLLLVAMKSIEAHNCVVRVFLPKFLPFLIGIVKQHLFSPESGAF
jgi:hypothetical protein